MTGKEYNNQFSEEELATEIWKDIPEWEGYYQASSLGRIKSLERKIKSKYRNNKNRAVREKILIPKKHLTYKYNRFNVSLCKNNIRKCCFIHRLVLLTFAGPCPKGMEGCHNDGNRFNNKLKNLRWDTPKNNQADRIKHGTDQYGEKNASSKLKSNEVIKIREMYKTGKYTQRFLAKKFNICYTTICYIVNNKRWNHI